MFQTTFPRVSDVWLANFNSQLANCYEPVVDEVAIPVEEDKQLLHQVCEDIVQLLGGEGRDVVLATVQDAAALAAPARDEVVRDVGSSVLNEPVLSSASPSVATLASCAQFLVQKRSMSLTEQVLLHRDAQLLGMQVISEDQNVEMLAHTSASPRHGEICGKFSLCRSPWYLPQCHVECWLHSPRQDHLRWTRQYMVPSQCSRNLCVGFWEWEKMFPFLIFCDLKWTRVVLWVEENVFEF